MPPICQEMNVMPATRGSAKRGVLRPSLAATLTILLAVGLATAPSSPAWAATTVEEISPIGGPVAGGDTLVIIGTELSDAISVTIGGADCPIIGNNSEEITCTV